jgi:hypothetical protein
MLWDGLTFFGFDDTKLGRLKGEPVSVWDKFKNKKWLISMFIAFAVIIFVLSTELSKLDSLIL